MYSIKYLKISQRQLLGPSCHSLSDMLTNMMIMIVLSCVEAWNHELFIKATQIDIHTCTVLYTVVLKFVFVLLKLNVQLIKYTVV